MFAEAVMRRSWNFVGKGSSSFLLSRAETFLFGWIETSMTSISVRTYSKASY